MHHQHFFRRDAMELGQRAHRLAGTIREGLRQQQPEARARPRSTGQAVKARLAGEVDPQLGGQPLTKPKPGVVPGFGMLGAGVAEADDQAQDSLHGEKSALVGLLGLLLGLFLGHRSNRRRSRLFLDRATHGQDGRHHGVLALVQDDFDAGRQRDMGNVQ